jgi:Ca2+-binding RTX toxin-like protein
MKLDNANAAVDALNDGDAVQDVFSYTVTDGHAQDSSTLNIAIAGHTDIPALFTAGNDAVDFNTITAGSYVAGTQYDALAGDDTVILPDNAAEAAEAGFVAGTVFNAGDGNNTVIGGGLNDIIFGGGGTDTIDGGAGDDRIDAGDGDDVVRGGDGRDVLDGGAGRNRLLYDQESDGVRIDLVIGVARGVYVDRIENFQDIVGSRFQDQMDGDDSDNAFYGGAERDELEGGGGADFLDGQQGDDFLTGGAGADVFHFDLRDFSPIDNEIIFDFEVGVDRISFAGNSFDDISDLHFIQVDADILIELSLSATIRLQNVNASLLTNADFLF